VAEVKTVFLMNLCLAAVYVINSMFIFKRKIQIADPRMD